MPQKCIGQKQNAQAGQHRADGSAGGLQHDQHGNDAEDDISLAGHAGALGNALPVQQDIAAAQQRQNRPTPVDYTYLCQTLMGGGVDEEQADGDDQPVGGTQLHGAGGTEKADIDMIESQQGQQDRYPFAVPAGQVACSFFIADFFLLRDAGSFLRLGRISSGFFLEQHRNYLFSIGFLGLVLRRAASAPK